MLLISLSAYGQKKKSKSSDTPPPPACHCIEEDHSKDIVEEMPQFPGGSEKLMKFIYKNTRWPKDENCIEGRVVVGFTVNEDGSLSDIHVARSVCNSADKEAIRVVKSMPKWIPAKNKGVPVKINCFVPIAFRLK